VGTTNLKGVKVGEAVTPVRVKAVALVAAVTPIITTPEVAKASAVVQSVRTTDTVEPGFDGVDEGTALGF